MQVLVGVKKNRLWWQLISQPQNALFVNVVAARHWDHYT